MRRESYSISEAKGLRAIVDEGHAVKTRLMLIHESPDGVEMAGMSFNDEELIMLSVAVKHALIMFAENRGL